MKPTKRDKILRRLANWRAYILHCLEPDIPPKLWPLVRTTVLKALGENGLKGDIQDIFRNKGD